MGTEQIEELGILLDEWVNLEQGFSQILFSNDGSLYPNKNMRFYFSSDGLLYCKYLLNDKPLRGGIKNNTVGVYHEVYDMDDITLIR